MIRERRLRDADGHLEFPECPLAVRKEFDDDLARDILSEDREDPPLGLHERPRDEIPLAMPVLFRLQEAAPLEVPEVVGKHPRGHAQRLADPTEMEKAAVSRRKRRSRCRAYDWTETVAKIAANPANETLRKTSRGPMCSGDEAPP